jgi:hypothetical protein
MLEKLRTKRPGCLPVSLFCFSGIQATRPNTEVELLNFVYSILEYNPYGSSSIKSVDVIKVLELFIINNLFLHI